jgi:hypothetical protein
MKFSLTIATVLLACAAAFGQPEQSQQKTTAPQHSTGMARHHRHGRMHHRCGCMGDKDMKGGMGARMGMKEHMSDMHADMEAMQSHIDKLRADADKVQDPAAKSALLDDADIWQQAMKRMESHMQMMEHGGMHHMDMMGGEHGCQCKHRGGMGGMSDGQHSGGHCMRHQQSDSDQSEPSESDSH